MTFENAYQQRSAQVSIGGNNVFDGDRSAVSSDNKSFTLDLFETDANFAIVKTPIDSVSKKQAASEE